MRHNFFWDWVYSCGLFLFNFVMCVIVGFIVILFSFYFKIKLVVRHWDRFELGCQLDVFLLPWCWSLLDMCSRKNIREEFECASLQLLQVLSFTCPCCFIVSRDVLHKRCLLSFWCVLHCDPSIHKWRLGHSMQYSCIWDTQALETSPWW